MAESDWKAPPIDRLPQFGERQLRSMMTNQYNNKLSDAKVELFIVEGTNDTHDGDELDEYDLDADIE